MMWLGLGIAVTPLLSIVCLVVAAFLLDEIEPHPILVIGAGVSALIFAGLCGSFITALFYLTNE